jgi:hypothetical protein
MRLDVRFARKPNVGLSSMQVHLGEFGPVRVFGRTLVIVCAYRGCARQEVSSGSRLYSVPIVRSVLNWLTLASLRSHIASLRDHYANPRPIDVQLGMVTALLDQSRAESVRTIFDIRRSPDQSQPRPSWAAESETADLASWVPAVRDIDTIILSYPDALGLTFGRLEQRLLAAGVRNIVVLTGRRRLFPLSRRAMRSFRWRRLLASTRIVELMAAIVIFPVAAALAGYDWLKAETRPRQ